MTALHIVLTVIQVILAVALVAIVTIQSGKSAGLSSAIGGGSGESSDGPVSLTLSLWDEAQLPVIQENVDAFNAAHEGERKNHSICQRGEETEQSVFSCDKSFLFRGI